MLAREYDLLLESTNSTIPRLEYLLNYMFYRAGLYAQYANRIRIILEKSIEQVALYLVVEAQPLYLNEPQYLYTEGEIGAVGVDFAVVVPTAAQPCDTERMTSTLRTYVLPDKNFKIIKQNE